MTPEHSSIPNHLRGETVPNLIERLLSSADYIDDIKIRTGALTIMEEGAQKLFREAANEISALKSRIEIRAAVSELNAGCPFCGASETDVEFINSSTWGFQRCKSCGATGPRVCAGHGGDSLEAWNMRALANNQLAEPVAERAGMAYHEREVFAYGRYIQCQILNWSEGPPPRYLICNPLHKDYYEEFLAHQAMGTWARCELRDVLAALTSPATISGDGSGAVTEALIHARDTMSRAADIIEGERLHVEAGLLRRAADRCRAALAPPHTPTEQDNE